MNTDTGEKLEARGQLFPSISFFPLASGLLRERTWSNE